MKAKHRAFLKVLDPTTRDTPHYTLSEVQQVARMTEEVVEKENDERMYILIFAASCLSILLMSQTIKVIPNPEIAMIASGAVLTASTMVSTYAERRVKKWLKEKFNVNHGKPNSPPAN